MTFFFLSLSCTLYQMFRFSMSVFPFLNWMKATCHEKVQLYSIHCCSVTIHRTVTSSIQNIKKLVHRYLLHLLESSVPLYWNVTRWWRSHFRTFLLKAWIMCISKCSFSRCILCKIMDTIHMGILKNTMYHFIPGFLY